MKNNQNDFDELVEKFKKISYMEYVKGVNSNLFNSCGLTFEKLIGKEADSMFLPDYHGIEIKCKQRYSMYDICLFSIAFDGPFLFESSYLLEKYGIVNKNYNGKKDLFVNLEPNKLIKVGDNYYFEMKIDDRRKCIYINIYDDNYNIVEKRGFLDYESIEKRLNTKLNKLALVRASKKEIDGELCFRYYKIQCFILKSFDVFLELLKCGVVKASIVLRFAKSGMHLGKNKNKGLSFLINQDDLTKLFYKVYEYEN